ncbi:serine hydrolase domain-containing protein [Heyndrickxia sp. NPDC080065]|uniref:serine hydrolase domain-containing protein n=1 Tax=Heyndrickxia sp. NPDC080065 TaxID=3390568 RepID=UPI003CFE8CE1
MSVENLVAKDRFSGSVLLADKDKILYNQAFGMANIEKGILNTIDTKFNLASLNKMFTGIAIAILEEQGKLSFNDFVIQYIPDFPFDNISIHQLLTHSSGMGDYFNEKYLVNRTNLKNVSDYLPLFIEDKLHFDPGTRFQYSNGGFIVLGLIIESISNVSYFEFVKENIFQPLNMNDTDFYEIDGENQQLAIGYTNFQFDGSFHEVKTDNLSMSAKGSPAGGAFSTIIDLWKFSKGLLNNELISTEQTNKVITEKENVYTDDHSTLGYGYGFFVETINGFQIVGHDGGFPGVNNRLDIFPNEGYIFIVLANNDNGGAALTRDVRKILT